MAPSFLLGASVALAATAPSAPAASLLLVSEHQDHRTGVTCVTNAWDAPLILEAAAVQVTAEQPVPAWPAPAPVWQPMWTSPTTARVPTSLNPESTSVVHWLGMKQRLLAAHASQLEFLVTRSYEHVQLDNAGRVVSSRRGDLDSVVTVDISTSSAIESREGDR